MTLEDKFHSVMEEMYYSTGKETGYWANYFLRSVRERGGLVTAKRMLSKKSGDRKANDGLQKLIDAGRPDLSVEYLVLNGDFTSLFTVEEIDEAKRRLDLVPSYAWKKPRLPSDVYPDELIDERSFIEGSKKRVTVNVYERDPKAREDCIKKFGYSCQVCGMNFSEVYGDVGKKFIHVHHKKPLACRRKSYTVNPKTDLIPVCPNCHAMLHTSNPPLGVEELKKIFTQNKKC